ncbi:unnamed protein product (macronuclear) [Paramecium tetraurelia]|uniref:Cache domain-containing protein n=1 Tax=Paramecium tetraurelia TaxID=5888 RepID=A0BS68_PARTE|nr:uncharacterized protein GSPATT00031616001 [Paramecium tetraurelia]CAK61385.1 unnamed protein product [Paramecium tetraurelia]|eukprot:XP_001428783.1 hypothetical protein (macronuclear) [Paramecium tetraurelia strain d4-2]
MNQQAQTSILSRCLCSKLGKFKMRTQILIINCVIFAIIIPSIILAQTINLYYIQEILSDCEKDSMLKGMFNHLTNSANSINGQLNSVFTRSIISQIIQAQITLTNLNQLYWLQLRNKIWINKPITRPCDYNSSVLPSDHFISIPCYANMALKQNDVEPLEDPIEQILRNHTSLVSSVILGLMGLDDPFFPNQFYFSSSIDLYEFTYIYPQILKVDSYHPKERMWFQQHFENLKKDKYNNTQLSDVYKYFGTETTYSMTMTQSMLNLVWDVQGIYCSDIVFSNKMLRAQSINIMIADQKGQLLLTNYKNKAISNSSELKNFADQEITGFNAEDWNSLISYYNQNIIQSTCNLRMHNVLCRYNTVYEKDVVITIQKLKNINYYLILFNDLQIEKDISDQMENLNEIFNREIQWTALIVLSIFILLIFISIILIYLIFLPIYQVIDQSSLFLKRDQECNNGRSIQFKNQIQNQILKKKVEPFNSNVLKQFKIQFDSLFDRVLTQTMTINPQCKILQQFKYPKNNTVHVLKIKNLFDQGLIKDDYYGDINNDFRNKKLNLKRTFSLNIQSN